MKIYIGFSTKKALVSDIIRAIEGSSYSHVYLRVPSKYGEYVYQASGLHVNFTNADIFKAENAIVDEYEFYLTEEQKSKLLSLFIKYAGVKYSTITLFKIAASIVCNKVGKNISISGDGDRGFICSELGALLCQEVLGMEFNCELDFVTPKYLHEYIRSKVESTLIDNEVVKNE